MHVTKLRIRRVYVVAREVSAEKRRYRRYRSAHASQSSIQNTTSCSGQRIADRRRCDRRANEDEASVLKRARNRWCHFLFFSFFFKCLRQRDSLYMYVYPALFCINVRRCLDRTRVSSSCSFSLLFCDQRYKVIMVVDFRYQ